VVPPEPCPDRFATPTLPARCPGSSATRRCVGLNVRLSEFINENRDQIIREWEEFAKTLSPEGTLPTILRDHVSAIIRSIVENMETFQGRSEEVEKSKGLGPSGLIDEVAAVHVNLRVETGLTSSR